MRFSDLESRITELCEAKRRPAARRAGDRTGNYGIRAVKNRGCQCSGDLYGRFRDKERRINGAVGKLPVEHADETFIAIRAAMKRHLGKSAGLSRKTNGNVRIGRG